MHTIEKVYNESDFISITNSERDGLLLIDSRYSLCDNWLLDGSSGISVEFLLVLSTIKIPDVPVKKFIRMMDKSENVRTCYDEFISIGAVSVEVGSEKYAVAITELGRLCENVRIIGTEENPCHVFITPKTFEKAIALFE